MGLVTAGGQDEKEIRLRVDGEAEAHLIALACSEAPEGRNRWTVRLLADQIVALGYVASCGKTTVHETLKKTN